MTATARLPRLAALLALALAGGAARADIFSPGDLARPHASLEGLNNCTKCHQRGEQLSPAHCLDCHKELKIRVDQRRGFHGRLGPNESDCHRCHHDHQGRDFKLVDWGPGGQKKFDHAKTGWALDGKHQKADCTRCHDPRHLTEPALKEVVVKGRTTFLGTPSACAACHFDEHRGQVGAECQRCHDAKAWKPARPFDHAKAAYKLEGKHAKVACLKCHADEPVQPPGDVAPKTAPVRPALAARYKPVPFKACADCHKKDPHQGRFGEACQGCHVPDGWKVLKGAAKEKAFHEKTRYPLRGAHLQAKCEACHGPFPGQKAVWRNMAFSKCTDCHFDAHLGQLEQVASAAGGAAAGLPGGSAAGSRAGAGAAAPAAARVAAAGPAAASAAPAVKTCDRCHVVDGFTPVRFELEDHQQLSYRLEGAHRAVACAGCHPKDARLEAKVPAAVRARLEAQRRPVKPSLALLDIPRAAKDCRACHRDAHAGQFQARLDKEGCTGCHEAGGWKAPLVRFDHQKESRFKLEGKHEKAACASCHRPGERGVVAYRPLPLACAGCHADVHAGQLAVKGKGTDCARCHQAGGWKAPLLRFDHQKDSRFKLEGKHKPLACDKCHPMATVAKGVETRRWRPLPLECEGCHADHHKGAFKGYAP